MPIPVTCRCGQKLAAKEEFAGKTVKCPKCQQPLPIPQPAKSASDASAAHKLLDEVGLSHYNQGATCSECGEPMADGAVLCVHCGYHTKLKRQIKPEGAPAGPPKKRKGPPKPQSEVDKTLAKAAVELEKEPIEQDQGYGSKWASAAMFLTLLVVALGIVAGGIAFFTHMEERYNAADKARQNSGYDE